MASCSEESGRDAVVIDLLEDSEDDGSRGEDGLLFSPLVVDKSSANHATNDDDSSSSDVDARVGRGVSGVKNEKSDVDFDDGDCDDGDGDNDSDSDDSLLRTPWTRRQKIPRLNSVPPKFETMSDSRNGGDGKSDGASNGKGDGDGDGDGEGEGNGSGIVNINSTVDRIGDGKGGGGNCYRCDGDDDVISLVSSSDEDGTTRENILSSKMKGYLRPAKKERGENDTEIFNETVEQGGTVWDNATKMLGNKRGATESLECQRGHDLMEVFDGEDGNGGIRGKNGRRNGSVSLSSVEGDTIELSRSKRPKPIVPSVSHGMWDVCDIVDILDDDDDDDGDGGGDDDDDTAEATAGNNKNNVKSLLEEKSSGGLDFGTDDNADEDGADEDNGDVNAMVENSNNTATSPAKEISSDGLDFGMNDTKDGYDDANIDMGEDMPAPISSSALTRSAMESPDNFLSPVARPKRLRRPPGVSPSAGSALVGTFIPTPPLPCLNEIGGKMYPDLRYHCISALVKYAGSQRHAAYTRPKYDRALRAVVILAGWEHPVRSVYTLKSIKGIGMDMLVECREACKDLKYPSKPPYLPKNGKLCCVTEAALVALYEYKLENHETEFCTMEELISRINTKIHIPHCKRLDRGVDYYLDKDTLCPNWGQVKKICSENVGADMPPLIKERRRKGSSPSGIVFEILLAGEATARRLQAAVASNPSSLGPLRQLASTRVDESYGAVTICVDMREGGGTSKGLHSMCDLLDGHRVPYVVREIKVADYLFFVNNKLAPVMVERKSVDDVANSLADGRWQRQQRNMRIAQYLLGGGKKRKCQMSYLIEGDVSKRTVHGGNVGRRSWGQTEEDVNNAITTENLGKLGFSKMESRSHRESMMILSRIARDVSWKVKNGSIDIKYTYDELSRMMKHCDRSKGDPPTDRIHQNPAPPVITNTARAASKEIQSRNGGNGGRAPSVSAQGADKMDEIIAPGDAAKRTKLMKMSMDGLKKLCRERADVLSGSKSDLVQRLLRPRKPEVLISRARRNQYVPKIPSSNAALMIALYIHSFPGGEGLSKERLMTLAEETGVSKDPMDGNGGFYDGWSGVKRLQEGDPPLISVQKRKYSLTENPPGSSGREVAKALHIVAHQEQICRCGLNVNI